MKSVGACKIRRYILESELFTEAIIELHIVGVNCIPSKVYKALNVFAANEFSSTSNKCCQVSVLNRQRHNTVD